MAAEVDVHDYDDDDEEEEEEEETGVMHKNVDRATAAIDGEDIETVSEEQQTFPTSDQEGASTVGLETDWNAAPRYKIDALNAARIRRNDSEENDSTK